MCADATKISVEGRVLAYGIATTCFSQRTALDSDERAPRLSVYNPKGSERQAYRSRVGTGAHAAGVESKRGVIRRQHCVSESSRRNRERILLTGPPVQVSIRLVPGIAAML